MPKSRVEFWRRKFEDNVARDATVRKALEEERWKVRDAKPAIREH
jgi:DNA mismatch endonuclease (patch repair protein)